MADKPSNAPAGNSKNGISGKMKIEAMPAAAVSIEKMPSLRFCLSAISFCMEFYPTLLSGQDSAAKIFIRKRKSIGG